MFVRKVSALAAVGLLALLAAAPPIPSGSVTGVVVGPFHRAVAGASVSVRSAANGVRVTRVLSAEQGAFRFASLRPGFYFILAAKNGWCGRTRPFLVHSGDAIALSVAMAAGNCQTAVEGTTAQFAGKAGRLR